MREIGVYELHRYLVLALQKQIKGVYNIKQVFTVVLEVLILVQRPDDNYLIKIIVFALGRREIFVIFSILHAQTQVKITAKVIISFFVGNKILFYFII